ncbi:phenylalanine--tRNA ligase subunit alpha, partial [Halolamina litorea]
MRLPERQVAALEAASATDAQPIPELADAAGIDEAAATTAVFELEEEGLLAVESEVEETVSITDEAETYLETGLPEVRFYRAAIDAGAGTDAAPMGQVIGAAGLEGPQVDIALSNFARKGYGQIESGEVTADPDADPDSDPEVAALEELATGRSVDDAGVLDRLEERGLIEREERTVRSVTLTDAGVDAMMAGVEAAETAAQLTPEMLTSGEWEDVEFTDYNVEADATEAGAGKVHVLRQAAERVKDVLVGMGFQEMDGPHADADFWINDALFMPQDHPARTHWDRFALDVDPVENLPEDLVEAVENAHRNGVGPDGDGYHSPWSEDFAREVALRGHTTSLSMRYLSGAAEGELEPPQRYFSVEKAYR